MKYWELVRLSSNGATLWKRIDIRDSYRACDPDCEPTDKDRGIPRKYALVRFALEAEK